MTKTWQYIYSGTGDPFFNLALDEVLFLENQRKKNPPLFRIYGWDKAAVSIGYFQKTAQACNLPECQKENLPVIRRITGGRAVFHQEDLTYSVVGSTREYPELGQNVLQTYLRTSEAFLEGLKMLGINAFWEKKKASLNGKKSFLPCFSSTSIYEVTYQGKKLIGSAQKRVGDSFIQQGSLPLYSQTAQQKILLSNGDHLNNGFEKKFTSLAEILNRKINLKEVADVFKTAWEKFWNIELVEVQLTLELIGLADQLVQSKYSQKSWNFLR
ncbi:MAG: hypothetical protein A2145_06665 [candidate division Zixibacteria bacterium RBG_16_40_9]|nr:MAG: hypothetical protein A2145_06665 [candidate division Zixibacteria bacterium RBG_16_40_9]